MSVMMCLFFMLTWTPYAVTALMYVSGTKDIPTALGMGAPIFAKTSLFTNPCIYFFAVKRFRSELMRTICRNTWTHSKMSTSHSPRTKTYIHCDNDRMMNYTETHFVLTEL